jgi:tetratricopeptide (TPR) repeat protein
LAAAVLWGLAPAVWAQADTKPKTAAEKPPASQDAVEQAAKDFLEPWLADPIGPHFQNVKDSLDAFRKGDVREARVQLNKAREQTPKLPPTDVMMAKLFFAAKFVPQGRAELERAAKTNPKDPEAFLMIAEIAAAEGRLAESQLMYRKAMVVNKDYNDSPKRKKNVQLRAYAGLSAIDVAYEQYESAKKHLEEWVGLDAENAVAHGRLGYVLFKLKDTAGAYRETQAAAKINEKLPPADVTMASYYHQANDKDNSKKHLEQAIKNGSKDFRTRYALAQWLYETNQLKESLRHVDAASQLDPKSLEALFLKGVVARMQMDFKTAEQCFEQVYLRSPANSDAMNQLALTLIESEETPSRQRALSFAKTNFQNNQQSVVAAATLGWVLFKMDRLEDAQKAFAAVAQAATTTGLNAETQYYFANFLVKANRTAEALQLLYNAVDNDKPFAYRNQANALIEDLKKKGGKPSTGSTSGATGRPALDAAGQPAGR